MVDRSGPYHSHTIHGFDCLKVDYDIIGIGGEKAYFDAPL